MNAAEITDKLGLHSLRHRNWYIQATCATSGDGLYEGLDWLANQLKNKKWGAGFSLRRFGKGVGLIWPSESLYLVSLCLSFIIFGLYSGKTQYVVYGAIYALCKSFVCLYAHTHIHTQINIPSVDLSISLNEKCQFIASKFSRFYRLSLTRSRVYNQWSVLSLTAMKKTVGSERTHVLCNMVMYFLVLSKCSVDAIMMQFASSRTQYPQSAIPAVRDCLRYPAVFCMALSLCVVLIIVV